MNKKLVAEKVWSWKVNLLVVAWLAGGVLAYSLVQVYQLRSTLQQHLLENREMVVGTVNRQIEQGVASEEALNDTIALFLSNTARFVHNLHIVEPFSVLELASYADENGLTGVLVQDADGKHVQGPSGWYSKPIPHVKNTLLEQNKKTGEVVFFWPTPRGGTVVLGFPDRQFAKLHQQFSLEEILSHLSTSPEINFIEIKKDNTQYGRDRSGVVIEDVSVAGHNVMVGFDTVRYEQRISKVWQDFFLYGTLLGGFGVFLSFLLYKYQRHYFEKIQTYERALAREQEDASLGRAAGTIAHEVRNPLNAIGIGLQRISFEANLDAEQEKLVLAMSEALRRTNTIVEGLLNYSRPLAVTTKPCNFDNIVAGLVLLRESQCRSESIDLTFSPGCSREVNVDQDAFSQVVDNLLKNSIEAQPSGGWITVETTLVEGYARLRVKNSGFDKSDAIDQLVEPYFTGKTRGSGLGLAICEKIVHAHGGQLLFSEPEASVLQVDVLILVA